jgi:hypothetical protein
MLPHASFSVLDINPNFAHVDKRSAGQSMFGALKNSVRGFDESQIGATLYTIKIIV